MKALRRNSNGVVALISLGLCLASVAAWVAGERLARTFLKLDYRYARWQVVSHKGALRVNNQPLVDWENSRDLALLSQLRSAERSRTYARLEYQTYRLRHDNGERGGVEVVWEPDAKRLMENEGRAESLAATYESALRAVTKTAFVERKLPSWIPPAVFGVLPGAWAGAWAVRRRRKVRGACVACGHSLTGNMSGVCPECGTAIASKVTA